MSDIVIEMETSDDILAHWPLLGAVTRLSVTNYLLNTTSGLYLETLHTALWTKLTDLDLIYKKLPSHLAHVRGPAEQ